MFSVSTWSSDNVTSWLVNIGVREDTVSLFSENRITGSVLFGKSNIYIQSCANLWDLFVQVISGKKVP